MGPVAWGAFALAILIVLIVLVVTNYLAFQTGKVVGRTDAVTEQVNRLVERQGSGKSSERLRASTLIDE